MLALFRAIPSCRQRCPRRPARSGTTKLLALTWAFALHACGCEQAPVPPKLPTCRLEAVSPPRLLDDARRPDDYFGYVGGVTSGPTQVGVPWNLVPWPVETVFYHILDRRSGLEMARYSIPEPDMMVTANDDLLAEWFPDRVDYCTAQSSLAVYEEFQDSVPAGNGYVVSDWPYFPESPARKMLFLGETMIIEAGEYHQECTTSPPPWVWWVAHQRDGSGVLFHSPDTGWWTDAGVLEGLAESMGHGFVLLGGANVSVVGDASRQYCCSPTGGSCLLQIGPDATIHQTECILDGIVAPGGMWIVGGQKTVLVGWAEGDTSGSPWRVRALRFDEGEPAETVGDFSPDWSAPGYGSGVPIWRLARAGDGFVALAELAGDDAGKRGLVLLDEAGATVQEVVVESLPPAAGVTLTGALEYALGTTDDCVDVEWMETDGLDVTEDGYPMRLWLQSFCCVE